MLDWELTTKVKRYSCKYFLSFVTRSLEHKVLHGSELISVVHVGLLDELGLGLVPENVLLQLGVDLILVHDGHAHLEMTVQKLVQLEILEQYNIIFMQLADFPTIHSDKIENI